LLPGVLIGAERRALALGIGADEVLVSAGILSAEQYASELAFALHLHFDDLETVPRHFCRLSDKRMVTAMAAGVLLLHVNGREVLVVAARGATARLLVSAYAGRSDSSRDVWITSRGCLQRFVRRHAYAAMVRHAADGLRKEQPGFSAAPPAQARWRLRSWVTGSFIASAALACVFASGALLVAIQVFMSALFLAWSVFRLAGIARPLRRTLPAQRMPDHALPTYTIIVALRGEAQALPGLVRALRAFDYPAELLDLKLVLEADDPETLAAAQRMQLGRMVEVIVAPTIGPPTKPKALNIALPLARGALIAVYDAEDRPEPDQLRRAAEAFAKGGKRLACVQARLTIDNTRDSWLTRLFTAEYAGLFDVMLPALCAFRLPIPLGGSSNHFRTAILRRAGAWDPYNVTEDADLGIRLARRGYHADVISSSTYEEAPVRLWAWMKQRTRWFKGWIQTWFVHMRQPGAFWRETGPTGFLAFQFMLFGTVLAALIHPFALAMLLWSFASGSPAFVEPLAYFHAAALLSGYAVSAALGIAGLQRRGLLATAWVLFLMPLHWLLLSAAAWRALYQFFFDRYSWEKTEHGKARTSRRRATEGRPRLSLSRS
jgi:cellulose synthase/poly-beta-1,6-N-acetylglucosamine synthase-like glycosyltransferase